jgi:hypothetical protein
MAFLERIRVGVMGIAVGLMFAAMYLQVATFAPVDLDPLQTTRQVWVVFVMTATTLMFVSVGLGLWLRRAIKRRGDD